MKIAQHPDTRQPLAATLDSPPQALCPHCGGVLDLRRRRNMDGSDTCFWRHRDNLNRTCNGRTRAPHT